MELTWDDFGTFYTEANRLIHPEGEARLLYPWQEQMGRYIDAHNGRFPSAIVAPTGSGKTTGVYAHVFRAALSPSAPPRFVHVTPRRALVDQMYEEMCALSEALLWDDLHPVLNEVKKRLLSRRLTLVDGTANEGAAPIITVARRGGMYGRRSREWLLDPNACTVMTMTAHQAMSGLLFKGYGTPLSSRSVESGMLAIGTTMVFDEAHTLRQAVSTARSISSIIGRFPHLPGSALEVVEMSATPTDDMGAGRDTLTVSDADYSNPDLRIGKVLSSPKPLTILREPFPAYLDDPKWERSVKGTVPKVLAAEALRLHESVGRGAGGRTVGVVTNLVADASEVAKALRNKGLTAVVITGRMRGADRDRLTGKFGDGEETYAGVLSSRGNPNVDVLVATQTVEIGVDINLAGMVTVVSSADSLAQRFGRVNRGGEETPAPITVVVPKESETKGVSIYSGKDISAAVQWMESLEDGNVSTLAVSLSRPPVRAPRRAVVEKLTVGDAIDLSMVSGTKSFADEDVDMWLSDDVERFPETSVVIREYRGGLDNGDRRELLKALPPESPEAWVSSPEKVAGLLNALTSEDIKDKKKILWNSNLRAISVIPFGSSDALDVVSGKDAVLHADHGRRGVRRVTRDDLVSSTVVLWADGTLPITDEFEYDETASASWIPTEYLRRNPYRDNGLRVHVLMGGNVPDTTAASTQAERWKMMTDAARQDNSFVTLPSYSEDTRARWAVVTPWEGAEEKRLSLYSPLGEPVLLDDHQNDVGETALKIAELCDVEGALREALHLAGLHHDDGKTDVRFQSMLRNSRDIEGVLAKSGSKQYRVDFREYGMPRGWRHEQLSAALTYGAVSEHPKARLITALVGMSHGNGRSFFPHGIGTLVPELPDGAADIFTDGTWEEILYDLTREYGPWHLAWLEALLRAADQTVSAQGH